MSLRRDNITDVTDIREKPERRHGPILRDPHNFILYVYINIEAMGIKRLENALCGYRNLDIELRSQCSYSGNASAVSELRLHEMSITRDF